MLDDALRAMCTQQAWLATPSTSRTAYFSANTPSTSRMTGPYPCHVTWEHSYMRGEHGDTISLAGAVQLATTVAISTKATSVRLATKTGVVFSENPIAAVHAYFDEDGRHHTSLVIGYG